MDGWVDLRPFGLKYHGTGIDPNPLSKGLGTGGSGLGVVVKDDVLVNGKDRRGLTTTTSVVPYRSGLESSEVLEGGFKGPYPVSLRGDERLDVLDSRVRGQTLGPFEKVGRVL